MQKFTKKITEKTKGSRIKAPKGYKEQDMREYEQTSQEEIIELLNQALEDRKRKETLKATVDGKEISLSGVSTGNTGVDIWENDEEISVVLYEIKREWIAKKKKNKEWGKKHGKIPKKTKKVKTNRRTKNKNGWDEANRKNKQNGRIHRITKRLEHVWPILHKQVHNGQHNKATTKKKTKSDGSGKKGIWDNRNKGENRMKRKGYKDVKKITEKERKEIKEYKKQKRKQNV